MDPTFLHEENLDALTNQNVLVTPKKICFIFHPLSFSVSLSFFMSPFFILYFSYFQ